MRVPLGLPSEASSEDGWGMETRILTGAHAEAPWDVGTAWPVSVLQQVDRAAVTLRVAPGASLIPQRCLESKHCPGLGPCREQLQREAPSLPSEGHRCPS